MHNATNDIFKLKSIGGNELEDPQNFQILNQACWPAEITYVNISMCSVCPLQRP